MQLAATSRCMHLQLGAATTYLVVATPRYYVAGAIPPTLGGRATLLHRSIILTPALIVQIVVALIWYLVLVVTPL